MENNRKVFNDPIHGNIELHPLCMKIVDTPQFQRLRFIKQLGGVYFVYPGAAHNRFEHSIGLPLGRLVRALRDQKSKALKDVDITPVDELCVEIAALCHDLGHGPFSHLFDRKIIPELRKGKGWEHENGSVDMLRYMLKENDGELEKEFKKENITLLDLKFIEELIVGPDGTSSKEKREFKFLLWKTPGITRYTRYEEVKHKLAHEPSFENVDTDAQREQYFNESVADLIYFVRCDDETTLEALAKFDLEYKERIKKKEFLFEIVSNKRNGIDVDKWDYFARDCHMLGIGSNFDHNRCIAFSRVIDVKGERQICYRDKEAANLYDMYHTRYLLHRRACKHKTNQIIEYMIAEALVLADDFITFPGLDGNKCQMSEAIDDMEAYSLLNDSVIYTILASTDPRLEKSKDIILRVLRRDLYKFVGEERLADKTFENEFGRYSSATCWLFPTDVKADMRDVTKSTVDSNVIVDADVKADMEDVTNSAVDCNVIVDVVNMNYGKKDKNPIDSVNFYSKEDPDNATTRHKEKVSLLLPKEFAEQLVRVYCKDPAVYTNVKKMFDNWSKNTNLHRVYRMERMLHA